MQPEEIQADLDAFLVFYNFERTHQGYRVGGKTPAHALVNLIGQQRLLPPIETPAQEVPAAA